MTIQNSSFQSNILCQFCCDVETLKKHYYVCHRYCMNCEERFADNSGLFEHLLEKHNKRFQCQYCPYFNFETNEVTNHIKNCWNKPKHSVITANEPKHVEDNYGTIPFKEENIPSDLESNYSEDTGYFKS